MAIYKTVPALRGFGGVSYSGFGDARGKCWDLLPQAVRDNGGIHTAANMVPTQFWDACDTGVGAAILVEQKAKETLQGALDAARSDVANLTKQLTDAAGKVLGPQEAAKIIATGLGLAARPTAAATQMISWLMTTTNDIKNSLLGGDLRALPGLFDPTAAHSDVHKLFFDPVYADAADAVAVALFSPVIGLQLSFAAGSTLLAAEVEGPVVLMFGPLGLMSALPVVALALAPAAAVAANLAQRPTPYLACIRNLVTNLTLLRQMIWQRKFNAPEVVKQLADLASIIVQVITGLKVSFMSLVGIGTTLIQSLVNAPQNVNWQGIIAIIFSDPLFLDQLHKLGGPRELEKSILAVGTCFQATSPAGAIACTQKVLEAVIPPAALAKLLSVGVSLDDARVVLQRLVLTNAQLNVAFDMQTQEGAQAAGSLMGLGVGGVILLMETVGHKNFETFWNAVMRPILGGDPSIITKSSKPVTVHGLSLSGDGIQVGSGSGELGDNILKGIKFFKLVATVFNQYRGTDVGDLSASMKNMNDDKGDMKTAWDILNKSRWDIPDALALMVAQGVFDKHIMLKNGQPFVTQELKDLLQAIADDKVFNKVKSVFCNLFALAQIKIPASVKCGASITGNAERLDGSVKPPLPQPTWQTQDSSSGSTGSAYGPYIPWLVVAGVVAAVSLQQSNNKKKK